MFNSPILDLVILLSFTYFIGSIILSAINEAIAGAFRLRQKDLRKGIENLFFDPQWKTFAKTKLLRSPQIQSLMKKKGTMPAYIPAKNFVLAVLENVEPGQYSNSPANVDPASTKESKEPLPADLVKVMKTLWSQADGMSGTKDALGNTKTVAEEFEKRMEEFYNNAMDRVTGWYKKRIRKISFVLGFALALALNIDTLQISVSALNDKDKLNKAVDNITANLPKLDSSFKKVTVTDTSVSISDVRDQVNNISVEFKQTTGYGFGYNGKFENQWKWPMPFWSKLLGILITTFALQLGSNNWFDILNKFINIRATGKRPDDKSETKK